MQKWYEWLQKKNDEKEKMEEMHQPTVAQTIRKVEGSAGLLHKITKPTARKGGAQILKKDEEDVSCEAKRKEYDEVQNWEDKPWTNEDLTKLEEVLPRLKVCELEKVSRLCKAQTGVGCDGFHLQVPWDLTKETRGELVEFLEKVEQSGSGCNKHARRCSFLIPKNVTSERPIALMPTLVRWWEELRAPAVAKWQQKYRVDWDATDGRNGGAQRTVWEILIEMERFKYQAERKRLGSSSRGLGSGKGLRAGQSSLWFGPGRRTSVSQGRSCECCAGVLGIRGECSSKDVWRGRSRPSRLSCQGQSGVACFYVLCCGMR